MWTVFKVFVEFVIIALLFYVLSFLSTRHVGPGLRDQTHTLCTRRTTREVPLPLLLWWLPQLHGTPVTLKDISSVPNPVHESPLKVVVKPSFEVPVMKTHYLLS